MKFVTIFPLLYQSSRLTFHYRGVRLDNATTDLSSRPALGSFKK